MTQPTSSIITAGRFSYDAATDTISGPKEYMQEQGDAKLARICAGEDTVFNMSAHLSPSIEMAILVALQTDFAGWLGARQLMALDKTPTRFEKGRNRGTKVCVECGKRTWDAKIDPSTGLCEDCYAREGYINEHNDGHHRDGARERCPLCQEAAEAPVTGATIAEVYDEAYAAAEDAGANVEIGQGCAVTPDGGLVLSADWILRHAEPVEVSGMTAPVAPVAPKAPAPVASKKQPMRLTANRLEVLGMLADRVGKDGQTVYGVRIFRHELTPARRVTAEKLVEMGLLERGNVRDMGVCYSWAPSVAATNVTDGLLERGILDEVLSSFPALRG